MSTANLEQLAAAQKANAEILMSLVRTAYSGLERLTNLNIAASRDMVSNLITNTQQILSVKDPGELAKVNAALAQPNLDKLMEYSRSVYELTSQMQKEMTSVIQSQYASFTQNANTAIAKTSANTPVGGDVFAATMQSLLNASTKAFDNINTFSRQLTEIAEANVQATSNAASTALSATAAARKTR